jgi:hypothetical protein
LQSVGKPPYEAESVSRGAKRRSIDRRFAFALGVLLMAAGATGSGGDGTARPQAGKAAQPVSDSDWIALPPDRAEFKSPNGRFLLVISTIDPQGWKSQRSIAELSEVSGDQRRRRWRQELPHAYRPRFATVGPDGEAVLFDQWINIKTRYAIVIIDSAGRQVATESTDGVIAAVGLPASRIAAAAQHGWWMQSPPKLLPDGAFAEVQVAGKTLRVRLRDGELQVR